MDIEHIQKILEDTDRSLIEIYVDLQKLLEEKYGPHTIVVMEVGSFFEVYGVDNDEMKIGKPKEVAEILNLQLTRKNKTIPENNLKNPLLAGFPTAAFDRYIGRLVAENKYTIVLVRQTGVPPKITRFIDRILSPGVNFEFTLDHNENFVVSLTIDEQKGVYFVGYSAIDVTTGKTLVQEIQSTREDPTFALDEVFRLLHSYHTSEILLHLLSDGLDEFSVRQYLELFETDVKVNRSRRKIEYQNELLKRVYGVESFLSPIESLDLETLPLASESLAFLLEFVIDHDVAVVEKLDRPKVLSTKEYLYLGNNPLEQLNVVSRDPQELTVSKLIDCTVTSIGRRLLRDRLFHPTTNARELEARYDLCDFLAPMVVEMDRELSGVYDMERILRRIRLGRLHPFEINFLYDSLSSAERILKSVQDLPNHAVLENSLEQRAALQNVLSYLRSTFNLEETTKVTLPLIRTSLFGKGFHRELDNLLQEKKEQEEKIEQIRKVFVQLLQEVTGKEECDFVEIRQLEKEGHHLSLTRTRFALIEEPLKKSFVSIDGTVYAFSDFSYKLQTTNVKISASILDEISQKIVALDGKIVALTKELYARELQNMEERFFGVLMEMTDFLSRIDVALSTVKAAQKWHLTRPEIVFKTKGSVFVDAVDLRHILVEAREESGIYVPNDIFLGDKSAFQGKSLLTDLAEENVRGVLLYGINSSGKSSLMKSIGVAVLLAQSGFFVPATAFRFTLFSELFTRIVAKDNFEKGLSSFAVEMVELKNIFHRCSPQSLILGDEISHGTETLSALSIVSATIEHLVSKKALFVFTTHLHQLSEMSRIEQLKDVVSVHLSVEYDGEQDRLVFDRKLQAGSGSSVYGLEFARSLHMDPEFMKRAEAIRKELSDDYDEIERLTHQQKSKYHKEVFLAGCAICKGRVEDTHHIVPQQLADEHGRVGHFHKNHKYNLLPLCKNCHHKVHEGKLMIRGFVMTSDGLQIDFTEV